MDIIKLPSLDEITQLLKSQIKIDIGDDKRAKIESRIENLVKDSSKKRVSTFRRRAELQKIFKESRQMKFLKNLSDFINIFAN